MVDSTKSKKARKNNVHDYEGDEMNDKLVDRISALPNDILVYLLSFAEMKTVGRTSLLSRRWRYVWTLLTDLIFEEKEVILQHRLFSSLTASEAERFSNWVDQVMISHRAPYLNTLRIHFPMYGSFGDNSIGKWVEFALKKNVINLELNLANVSGRCMINTDNLYDKRPAFRHNYCSTTLKSLHLEAIYIQGPAVENILRNCVNVERLIIRSCHFFPNMITNYYFTSRPYTKVVVSSLKLKHLEFSHCSFESIQISASQLTSFVLIAEHEAVVEYTNVPSLVDVTFKAEYCYHNNHNLNVFSPFFYRLQKLSIYWSQISRPSRGFPHLHKGTLLHVLTSFIEACPLLHTFKLEVNHSASRHEEAKREGAAVAVAGAMRAHEHLKVVEFVGFDGSASLVELAICLTQHSPVLKQIIFDPRCSQLMGGFRHINNDRTNAVGLDFARRQARLLVNQIRRGVDVVIL